MEIERGRCVRPHLSRDQQICKFCLINICDDEIDLLPQCDFHDAERVELFQSFYSTCENFENFDLKDNAIYIVNMQGSLQKMIANNNFEAFEKRIT